ncbi:serine/threonine-protein kinase tnni3k-related [Anaeramoeba flamelloides]|uniref:Serine/threonine-protein kinase tnni3k-related n=1 Tax=Anaeramoeba flamelloides TaxID=1746091 RepID=A0ABQ8YIN7_9EUKA|nr:serine/threonine-protein kinase tnni3k-related [Anaeramoeba flamelloides]
MDLEFLDQSFNYSISEHKYDEFVKLMKEKAVDVNYRLETFDFETLLHKAIEMVCFPIVKYLVEHSASVTETDCNRLTPLQLLCSLEYEGETLEESLKIMRILLHHKSDPNERVCKGSYGRTALYLSIENKNYHLAETLINRGAEINVVCGHSRRTVLHVAAMKGPKRLILLLLRYGADPLIKDKKGNLCYDLIEKKRPDLSEELKNYSQMYLDYSPNCILQFANTYKAIISGSSDFLINPDDVTNLESICEGSYGVVYKGKYQDKYEVAVKRFKNATTPRTKQLIIREIAICCACNHQNILKMHGYFYAPIGKIEKQTTKSNTILGLIHCSDSDSDSDSNNNTGNNDDNSEISFDCILGNKKRRTNNKTGTNTHTNTNTNTNTNTGTNTNTNISSFNDSDEIDALEFLKLNEEENSSSQSWITTEWMPTDLHSFLYPPSEKNIHHQGFFSNQNIIKLDKPTILKIIKGIAQGMKYLHYEKKIVHRDLKPENILLDSEKEPKIMDFGLSRFETQSPNSKIGKTSLKRTMTLNRGTDLYMAPEMKRKDFSNQESDYSFPVDVFSFGLIMWEIIMRQKPRELAFIISQKKDISSIEMPSNEDCSSIITELIIKCIKINMNERPKFEEICQVLDRIKLN